MTALRTLLIRLRASLSPSRQDAEFADELESHLQLHIDDNLRAGMTPAEARRAAIVRLGGVRQTRERHRDRAGLPIVDALRQDVTYAVRTLRKNPGFTATATLTLALGIGATSAIFSVVNAVLLRPLPFGEPERLVKVWGRDVKRGDFYDSVSYPIFVDWREQSHSFESMAAYANRSVTITVDGVSELVPVKRVTPAFFDVLRARPAIGRLFRADDADPGRADVVVLSDGFWKRHYGGSADIVGKTLQVAEGVYTIVGVLPPEFRLDPPDREQLYAPQPIDPSRNHGFLQIVARLRPGVTIAQAQADLEAICRQLARLYPRTNETQFVNVMPLVHALVGPTRLPLLILLGAVTLVLLIACTNVASLLLARSASRQRELAVRAALGAGRGRLARQLLTESVLLSVLGGGAGLLLAGWLARLLVTIVGANVPISVPRLDATHTDGWVLVFTLVISLGTGILFGVAPALASSSPDLNDALRDAGRTASGVRAPRVRRGLVVLETALALVLLTGAGVLVRTLLTLRATQPGFNTDRVLVVDLWLPPNRFPGLPQRAPFFTAALDRIHGLPGVQSAAFVADLPLNFGSDTEGFHIVGQPDPPSQDRQFHSGFNIATAGYFRLMGIPMREGREFLPSDGPAAPGVIVINQSAARQFWPDRSPLGQQIDLPITGTRSQLLTVVGVASDVRHHGLAEPSRPEIFVSSIQSELTWSPLVLVVRTMSNPTALAEPVKTVLRDVNPGVPITRVNTMEDVVARSIATPRLISSLFAAFATVAVLLAAIGLYGLISYSVAQQSHEMGIRVALGATPGEITRLVLTQGLGLAAAGAVLGLAGGLAATRALVGLMKGIEPNDPVTFAVVTIALLATAALASYLPARRAARVDPVVALRAE